MAHETNQVGPLPVQADDDVMALLQQLEEINCFNENQKNKGRADSVQDIDLAISTFQREVQAQIDLLNGLKLAHSIAHAVNTDGRAISETRNGETQAENDRHLAMRMSGGDPELENPPPYREVNPGYPVQQRKSLHIAINRFGGKTAIELESDSDEGGPSRTYAERQEYGLEKLSRKEVQCCVCCDSFRPHEIVHLECGDEYCTDCVKSLFMRATKDQTLFPPRCCRRHIPLPLISTKMSTEELDTFKNVEIEFSTTDRTYCSNIQCGRFILPTNITADKAECNYCGSSTCAMCKSAFHNDDCPEDTSLKATLDLAASQGWQRCFACKAVVQLGRGCYHIT
jgi:hypothetical protein